MDTLKYVDSKDIRNYLEETGYEFSSLETVWLIWQCENISLEEKLTAYQEIIDTLPDVPINYGEYKSLHKFLQAYISSQKQGMETFFDTEDTAVYRYRTNDMPYYEFRLFSSFDECIDDVRNKYVDQPDRIFIRKDNMTRPYSCNFELKLDKTVLSVNPLDDVYRDFWNFCVDIESGIKLPVPFIKGDIVWDPNGMSIHPFVFTKDGFAEEPMKVYSFYTGSGIYEDYKSLSTGMDYYPAETFTDEDRVLQILSKFLKGKIDVDDFANGYHKILTEESVKDFNMPRFEKEVGSNPDDDELPF